MSADLNLVLRELQDAQLIHAGFESEPTLVFKHVLTQETVYHSLLLKRRQELHRRVAATIEQVAAGQLDEQVPTLAHHYWWGEDWPQAARYARRAGERAMQVFALREAKGYFARALQALDRQPGASGQDICDVILAWEQAAFGFEPFPQLLQQLDRAEQVARQLGDKRRLALVLHAIGSVHVASGHSSQAGPPLEECFVLATEIGEEAIAMLPTFAMGMATLDSDPRRAVTLFDRAVQLARAHHDVDIEAYSLSAKAMGLARLGEDRECRKSVEETFQIVDQVKSPMADSDARLYSAWAYLDLGDVTQGLEYAKQGVEKAISADNAECACFGFACLGFGHLRARQVTEAAQAFEEALRRSKVSGAEEAEVMGQYGLGMVHYYSGRPEAVQELESALAHARRIGNGYAVAMMAQTLGEISLQSGQIDQALAYLDAALDYYRRNHMRPFLKHTLELMATAWERQGEIERANQARAEETALEREPA